MNKIKLWMIAAILICGLMVTACSNDDNPISPKDKVEEQDTLIEDVLWSLNTHYNY